MTIPYYIILIDANHLQQLEENKMKKMIIGLVASVSMLALLAGCQGEKKVETEVPENPVVETPGEEVETPKVEPLKVATSIHPVDELVRIVGGDYVDTWKIVPEGAEAHDFEPTIRDMGRLTEVDFMFINGLEMEPWVEKAVENSGNKDLKIIDLSVGVDLISLEDGHDHDHDHEEEDRDDHEDHNHGEFDPHIWLSIDALMIMAENVKDALSTVMPEAQEIFEENLAAFVAEATTLKSAYVEKFQAHEGKAFVTGHEAFGYLTREMGLVQKAIQGPFLEGEPTPRRLETLINFVKDQSIATIFLEEAASPRVSETLARETGSEIVVINALETQGNLLDGLKSIYDKIILSFES